jgi:hypothetical protein
LCGVAGHGRRLIDIDAGHNLPMTRPAELAAIIVDLVHHHHCHRMTETGKAHR